MPERDAWADLINGLGILRYGNPDTVSPLHCERNTLNVMSDPNRFTPDQVAQLERMGFNANWDEGTFYSRRFDSA